MTVSAPELLRPPAPGGSEIARFLDWLRRERGLAFDGYDELHRWSVDDLDGFWSAIWEFFEPTNRSPSQWPGTARSSICAGRSLMRTASKICP